MADGRTPEIPGEDEVPGTPEVAAEAARHGGVTRRQMLCAAAVAGACGPLLAACGGSSSSANAAGSPSHPSGTPGKNIGGGSGGGSGGGGGNSAGAAGGGATIATTNQIPNGGGVVLPQDGVVITQPKSGEFKGFSSTCTHAGCTLHDVSHGTINCICHGSRFSIVNGSVVRGPAVVPLPKVAVSVSGKDISLA